MRTGWVLAGLLGLVAAGGIILVGRVLAIETPEHRVEIADGDFELRRYPALVVAEVTRPGDRNGAVRAGFVALADYIFAKDRPGEKIAMTAPVTQNPAEGGWTVRFMMPGGRSIDSLPVTGGDVRLVELPPARVATVRVRGRWTDANFAQAEARLRAWIAARGLEASGPATLAYYDPPFKPWFLRRNEILLPVGD